MKRLTPLLPLPALVALSINAQVLAQIVLAQIVLTQAAFAQAASTSAASTSRALTLVYPPDEHHTQAEQIFLIGSAPANSVVTLNGSPIENRSFSGHFAPSVPLRVGENIFTLDYQGQVITRRITRLSNETPLPSQFGFLNDSLQPSVDIARRPNEPVCFRAIATPNAKVTVRLGQQTLSLLPAATVDLPPNSSVLTLQNQPQSQTLSGIYQGCTEFSAPENLGRPMFIVNQGGQQTQSLGNGSVRILDPQDFEMVEVVSEQGVARTGPSTDYSRLTPLPKGTQDRITAREGEWLRLSYGAWIKTKETRPRTSKGPVLSVIRSLRSRPTQGWTEVVFPLQMPVPVSVQQGDGTITLTLHNTTAQTDTIYVPPDAVIERLDWSQSPNPGNLEQVQYQFKLKSKQAWGYKLRYEGTSLILSLRHPPQLSRDRRSLKGTTILLDAGHGSVNDLGSVGPNGYPEKDATLFVTKILRDQLVARGATVIMTREGDEDLYPQDRVDVIDNSEPTIALSLHFNALPDSGDAINTKGIGTFWYHPQAYDLSVFLHDYLVKQLRRDSYGVFWNNLALTRPALTPSVLLELGFMINPEEFEWITDQKAQTLLGEVLADGITDWFHPQIYPQKTTAPPMKMIHPKP